MLKLLSVNFDTLPRGLLEEAKQHLRVEFTRDDDYIAGSVARALSELQAATDLTVFPSLWEWQPDQTDTNRCGVGVKVPLTPVNRILKDDGTGTWVDYDAVAHDYPNVYITQKEKLLRLEAGYQIKEQIPPLVLNTVLLLTGALYENREAVQAGTFVELPDMTRRLLTGMWRPSV